MKNIIVNLSVLSSLLMTTLHCGTARAAEPAGSDRTSAGDSGSVRLAEVVVTAQRREERLLDVPVAISVLSGEHLDASQTSGVVEELNRVPAVAAIAGPDGRATIVVRGIAAQVGVSPVGYYVDSAPFTFLGVDVVPDADVYDLERIEVLRGPQGSGYGIGSSSGVVRILTNDPNPSKFEAKGRFAVSSTDGGKTNYRGDAAVNAPILDGRLAVRAVVGVKNMGGWIDRPNKENFNDDDATSIRFKIGGQLIEGLNTVAGVWHSKRRFGPAAADDNAFRNVTFDETTDSWNDLYSFVLSKDFSSFSLVSATNYVDMYSSLFKRSIFSQNVLNDYWQSHALSQEFTLTSNSTGPWKWIAGAFYRAINERYRLRQTSPLATINTAPYSVFNISGADSYAAFGELSYAFSRFELLAGLRYSKEERDYRSGLPGVTQSEGTFNKVTPRAVFNWKLDENVMTYVSYSQGFRSGILQDQTATARGFLDAKSDLLNNYELGSKATVLGGVLSWEGAVYYLDWQDVQQNLTFPFGGTFVGASVNAGSASGFGGELSVTFRPVQALQIGANYSQNNLQIDADLTSGGIVLYHKGDRLARSPKYTYGYFADYTAAVGKDLKFRVGANYSYVSSQFLRFLLGGVTDIPARPIKRAGLDIGVGRSDDSSRVSLFVENLTNEKEPINNNYAAANPPIGNLDEGLRPRPRTVGVQIEAKF